VSYGGWRMPCAAKMHVFKAKIGGHQKLKAGLKAEDGAIVAYACFHGLVGQDPSLPPDLPNQTSFTGH
jgi:hypothetical protein